MRIIIVGGGIGGLSLALHMQARGMQPLVCEAVRDPQPLGVGIVLHPPALEELSQLGLAEEVLRFGAQLTRTLYMTADGQEIHDEPAGLAAGFAHPAAAVDRGKLQMLLLERTRLRLGPENVRTGMQLARWELRAGGVRAQFLRADGRGSETIEADALVGADGVRSHCRRILFPSEIPPRQAQRVLWRGLSNALPPAGPETRIAIGDDARKAHVFPMGPLRGAQTAMGWLIDLPAATPQNIDPAAWTSPAELADLLPQLAGLGGGTLDLPGMVAAGSRVYRSPKTDRDPLPCWSMGPTTLLGDAAHPSFPAGINAATQAMLDAACLAAALDRAEPVEAFRAYEAERRPCATRIWMANRSEGPERMLDLVAARRRAGASGPADALLRRDAEAMLKGYRKLAGLEPKAKAGA